MKKLTVMITLVALMVGASSVAFAKGTQLVKKDVDLTVTVSDWATISDLKNMTVKLTEPGQFVTDSQPITIKTNTGVTVNVSEPVLKGGGNDLVQATGTGALKWGLGFRSDNDPSDSLIPPPSFKLKAGSNDERQLVFWAKWDNDNWWQLIAADYNGTATITVASSTAQH